MMIAALSLLGAAASGPKMPAGGVPASLMSHFTTGVNITRWFNYTGQNHNVDHYRTYMLPADFAEFKKLGIGFVRLCVGPQEIYRDAGSVDPITLQYVDKGVARLTKAGLAVVWDLHDNGSMKLADVAANRPGFVKFWSTIARHYQGRYEKMLVFELKNEPMFLKNPQDWYRLQEDTVAAIRKVDPARTIMVSGTSWSSPDQLQNFKPLKQKNLVYTAHCYDPFFFTHQGASWVGAPPSDLKHIPFPSSPEAAAAVLDDNPAKEKETIEAYGRDRYNDAYLVSRMRLLADYAHQWKVPIILGEFGANPPVSPQESRANWFRGMRAALDETGLPWCLWGYDDGMGLGRTIGTDGKLWLDPVTLRNLFRQP